MGRESARALGAAIAVRSMLKALGLTIWGLIAFGLLAIFIFVGFKAALKYRAANGDQSKQVQSGLPGGIGASPSASSAPVERPHDAANSSTRKLLLAAAQNRRYDSAIMYGQKLIEEKSAGPADLAIVAQAYLSVSDCANAQLLAQKSRDAFHAAGLKPDDTLARVSACCGRNRNQPRSVLGPAQKARIDQLLSETAAAKSDSGGPLVRLGELYYGFGEYELAIASIQLGLQKGRIEHLDEAYVYLGRAEQAVGDLEEARNAFNRLKEVPGISPRVLRLWTLYAETLEIGECPKTATP